MAEFFPNDKASALAMLFIEKQDISALSPAELLDKYDRVHREISDRIAKKGGSYTAPKPAPAAPVSNAAPEEIPAEKPADISGFTFN